MLRSALVVATAFAIYGPVSGYAAEHWICQDFGHSDLEKIDAKEGHGISLGNYSCVQESGPLKGAVGTGTNWLEWNGAEATVFSGAGVARAPEGVVVFKIIEGKLTLSMDNGKVTGWTAKGRNSIPLATGAGAPLQGKTVSWTAKTVGAGRFMIDAEDPQ